MHLLYADLIGKSGRQERLRNNPVFGHAIQFINRRITPASGRLGCGRVLKVDEQKSQNVCMHALHGGELLAWD